MNKESCVIKSTMYLAVFFRSKTINTNSPHRSWNCNYLELIFFWFTKMFGLQIVMDKVVDDTNLIKISVFAIFNMWPGINFQQLWSCSLFYYYLILTSVLDSKINTQNRHVLPGLAKIELVSIVRPSLKSEVKFWIGITLHNRKI